MKPLKNMSARTGFVLISAAAIVSLVGALSATHASASSTSTSIAAAADSYVISTYPTTNYGTSTQIRVDASPDTRSFVRFSVSGLNGQTISQALLQIYANSSSSVGISAASVADNTWSETGITYNNMPASGSILATSGAVATGAWISLDVTSYVRAEGVYSFDVSTAGSTAISLASRESGANAPRLVLTLGGTTSATATPTTASAATPTPTSSGATATPTPVSLPSGSIKHVFIIVMENKSYSQVWNTSSTHYITQLGNSYVRATSYYATGHPSLPDYLEMYAGSNYGITTDCNPSSSCHSTARNLADNLDAAGLTWKGYMESMPSPCYLRVSGNYAPKHNPFVYFDDIYLNSTRCNSHVVPYSQLSSDLSSASRTPNYVFISPDQCNDMHSCSIRTGDDWLKNNVPPILNSPACTSDKCLLVVTWDEDDGSSGNHVLTIFAGSAAKTGGTSVSTRYTHYSLLRTVEYIFGLPTQTSNDAAASPMTSLLR